jgi:glucose dehydrogenase
MRILMRKPISTVLTLLMLTASWRIGAQIAPAWDEKYRAIPDATALLAVDLRTGKRKWHFQLVHHGVWDYDLPCAPILADITVDGRRIKAVAQASKQGFLYVFDRVTVGV